MDLNTQNSSGMMNGMPPVIKEEKKIGPIIGVLVIVLVLIIAALYFFGQRLNTQPTNSTANTQTNSGIETASNQSANVTSSTSVESIQKDIDSQLKDVDYSF